MPEPKPDAEVFNDDVLELLRALGIPDHARPVSAHEVVQGEILPFLRMRNQNLASIANLVDLVADQLDTRKLDGAIRNLRALVPEEPARPNAIRG